MIIKQKTSLHDAFLTEALFGDSTKEKLHYVGKTKNLIKCEKLLSECTNPTMRMDVRDILANRFDDKSKSDIVDDANKLVKTTIKKSSGSLINSKKIDQVEKLLEKEFGFKEMTINVLPIARMNAITVLPNMIIRDTVSDMPGLLSNKGRYYDFNHSYYCVVTIFVEFFDGRFTGGEILAAILHEIGHNFDTSVMSYVHNLITAPLVALMDEGIYSFEKLVQGVISTYILQTIVPMVSKHSKAGFKEFIKEFKDWFPQVITIYNLFLKYTLFFKTFITNFEIFRHRLDRIKYLIRSVKSISLTPINILFGINNIGGVQSEVFADSFATVYGYGSESITLEQKIKEYNDVVPTFKTGNFIFDTTMFIAICPLTVIAMLVDEHPESQTRAKLVLEDMEKLSKNKMFPPKVRESIKKEYEKSKQAYDNFVQVDPDKKKAVVERFSREFSNIMLNGKMDLRTYLVTNSAIKL